MPDAVTSSFRLRLFGPLQAERDGRPLPRLRSRKGYWILALLVLRHGREVERSWLAGTLWPDSPAAQALANLRNSLRDLRRALGPEGGRLFAPSPQSLALDLSGAQVDLLQFDAAVAREDPLSLQQAVSLYRGPLLEGCAEEWVFQERQTREEAYLRALETLAGRARADGDVETAAGYLRRAAAVDPLRETTQRALMEALAAGGNIAAATEGYRDLRLRLHRELNAEPDPETRAVYEAIRAEARQRAASPAAAGKRPGTALAAGRAAPEAASPPLRSPAALLHNLPRPLTSFVGREKELAEVKGLLSRTALLTLTGSGGCGKTRLALRAAEEVLESYPDGAWLVELAALTDPALVPQTVAVALGVREEPNRPLLVKLADYLRPKALLLVVDNCEHLLPGCAQLADRLLRSCPKLQILSTSREGLGIAGEMTFRVPSLSVPDLRSSLPVERLAEYEAVRLFTERAGFGQPSFALTPQKAPAVVQICQQLDGIPLAIELAAARVKTMPVDQIAARLGDRFRLLTGGSRTALPRHQTLRALIDWSYDLLSEAEGVLLRRLSVFGGGWTLEAAEAICSDFGFRAPITHCVGTRRLGSGLAAKAGETDHPVSLTSSDPIQDSNAQRAPEIHNEEVLDQLASLVEKSLVHYEERAGEGRYGLLETVRQYARERLLEADEAEAVQARHCEWYLALAEQADEEEHGSEQIVWLDWLEREHGNLRAALAWCRTSGGQAFEHSGVQEGGTTSGAERLNTRTPERRSRAEEGLRLGGALAELWEQRCYYMEGYEHLAALLALPGAQARTAARAKALVGAGHLTWYQRKYAAAQALFEESLAICRELGNEQGIALSLFRLAGVAESRGARGAARALFEESLATFRGIGDPGGIVWSLSALGRAAMNCGEYKAGRTLTKESLAIFREHGNRVGIGWSLCSLGRMAHYQGDFEAARALLEEGLANFRELGNTSGIACLLGFLGDVFRDQGEYGPARELYEGSLAFYRELAEMESIALSMERLGEIACHRGDDAAARALLQEMAALGREWGDQGSISELCLSQGNVLLWLGDYAAARSRYEEGLARRRAEDRPWHIAAALLEAAHAAWLQTEPVVTVSYAVEALGLFQILDDKSGLLCGLESLAAAALAQGRKERAARLLGAVAELRETLELSGADWWRRRERMGEAVRAASLRETFAAAWAEGQAISLDEAVAVALAEDDNLDRVGPG